MSQVAHHLGLGRLDQGSPEASELRNPRSEEAQRDQLMNKLHSRHQLRLVVYPSHGFIHLKLCKMVCLHLKSKLT